jgi:hypothetical protein
MYLARISKMCAFVSKTKLTNGHNSTLNHSETCLKVCVLVAVDLLEAIAMCQIEKWLKACLADGTNLNVSCTERNAWWIHDSDLKRYCCFHCGSKS